MFLFFFFFNDTATTEIYTLSLHDALPIYRKGIGGRLPLPLGENERCRMAGLHPVPHGPLDRKSTRLNSSHGYISYAVFCLKKKKKQTHERKVRSQRHQRLEIALRRAVTDS